VIGGPPVAIIFILWSINLPAQQFDKTKAGQKFVQSILSKNHTAQNIFFNGVVTRLSGID